MRAIHVDRYQVESALEPKIRQVTVADRDAGARHQQTIDGRHQAAEQGGGRREAESCSLGHVDSLCGSGSSVVHNLGIPDASHNSFVCIAA
jgi:hypothetical protein